MAINGEIPALPLVTSNKPALTGYHIYQTAFPFGCTLPALIPIAAQAQQPVPAQGNRGFYVGLESGLNWLLNSKGNNSRTGYAIGGVAGYDFIGPRVEVEVMYRNNGGTGPVPFSANGLGTGQIEQLSPMLNALYDFRPGALIMPYAGAGIGLAFVDPGLSGGGTMCSTNFAYQGIIGVGYNASPSIRVNLDARYYGTTSAGPYGNNDISVMLGATNKFGRP